MKARFKLLRLARPFALKAQVRSVAALCVLFNILGAAIGEFDNDDYDPEEDLEKEFPQNDGEDLDEDARDPYTGYHIPRSQTTRAARRRDRMAQNMWDDYQAGLDSD